MKKKEKVNNSISKHISFKEATYSQTASKHKIKNVPTELHLKNMKVLAEKCFEPLREWCDHPIRVNSMYRSQELCEAIPNSSKTSQHTKGQAIDMTSLGEKSNRELFFWIKDNLDFDQMIWEFGKSPDSEDGSPRWIHLSYVSKKANRNNVLVAKYKGSQATYYRM
jgi:zinc D-Ala-D-Ala carboxypeptidase